MLQPVTLSGAVAVCAGLVAELAVNVMFAAGLGQLEGRRSVVNDTFRSVSAIEGRPEKATLSPPSVVLTVTSAVDSAVAGLLPCTSASPPASPAFGAATRYRLTGWFGIPPAVIVPLPTWHAAAGALEMRQAPPA